MSRYRLLTIVVLAAVAGLGWMFWPQLASRLASVPGLSSLAGKPAEPPGGARQGRPAVPVVTAKVERRSIPITLDAVGTVQAIASITIRARVDSQVVAVHVEEGARVNTGDLLFTLDARALQAQIAQVDAQIQKAEAQLEQARRDLARADELLDRKIASPVQRDTAMTQLRVQEAQLAADRAQHRNLTTSLSYTEIRAPVAGRIGSIAAKVGTVVRSADAVALATVNQFDPIYVAFAIPQAALAPLRRAMAEGAVAVEVRAPSVPVHGTVAFVENAVDLATGTVPIKASLPNTAELLWPGAFAAVRVQLGVQADAVVVPASAVQLGQDGPFVFTVAEGKAQLKRIRTERTQGGLTVVSDGLAAGEDVVVDGQLRLVNGAPVARDTARSPRATPTLANGS